MTSWSSDYAMLVLRSTCASRDGSTVRSRAATAIASFSFMPFMRMANKERAVRLPLSFEFFPPKTPEGAVKLRAVRQQLYVQKPEFCSVTYGAGGSTHDGTFGTIREILDEGVEAACHFSCIGATKSTVRTQL